MLISVVQTLAHILAEETSINSTEYVDFGHPSHRREEGAGPTLNLYVYDLRESKQMQHSGRQVERKVQSGIKPTTTNINWSPSWFDVSILLTAWDRTALGEHHLLSESLRVLLKHRPLKEDLLLPELKGYGNLSMTVALDPPIEVGSLWSALNVPLRAGLYLTVTVPLEPQSVNDVPLVWERIFGLQSRGQPNGNGAVATTKTEKELKVAIAGVVKSEVANQPLVDAKITVSKTEKTVVSDKSVVSDQEGIFFFENLPIGRYILTVNYPGYVSQKVNVRVDDQTYTFKEILLAPE
jgi:hypothetical protein